MRSYLWIKARKVYFDGSSKPFDARYRITAKSIAKFLDMLQREGMLIVEQWAIEKIL